MHTRSPSSPAGPRLWRPAAQRNVRNSWSSISKYVLSWNSASSSGLTAATSLVNSILSHSYVNSMNFGVLRDMKDIRVKARNKFFLQGESYCVDLLKYFKDMVNVLVMTFKARESMRTYLKSPVDSAIIEFSDHKSRDGDTGDGDGLAVFSSLTLASHEMLAKEILNMFLLELQLKFDVVMELHSLLYSEVDDDHPGKLASADMLHDIFVEISSKVPGIMLEGRTQNVTFMHTEGSVRVVKREILQVYLTAWLAEVNIDKSRRLEILKRISEEIQVNLLP